MFANQRDVESTKRFHAIQEQTVKKKSYIYMIDKRPEMM
jgi:hypothetical protein